MADLLILSTTMPKSCMDCELNFEGMGCRVTGERWWSDSHVYLEFDPHKERLWSCPRIELGDYGDLIDRAKLLSTEPDVVEDGIWTGRFEGYSKKAIMNMRPVIPASPRKKGEE